MDGHQGEASEAKLWIISGNIWKTPINGTWDT